MKIRNGREGFSIVSTTKEFSLEYADRFRLEVEGINDLPIDAIFDLAVAYDCCN